MPDWRHDLVLLAQLMPGSIQQTSACLVIESRPVRREQKIVQESAR